MEKHIDECAKVFFRDQRQLFDEPVAYDIEEAKEFLEECMAVYCKNIKELLFEVSYLQKKIMNKFENAESGKVMINSKNPIYNMALIECQNQKSFVISTYKNIKEKIIGNLMARGNEEKETLEDILSFFLEKGQNMEENHGR